MAAGGTIVTEREERGSGLPIIKLFWAFADDVLRDLFKRGKYPDVILPMSFIQRTGCSPRAVVPGLLVAGFQRCLAREHDRSGGDFGIASWRR